MGLGSGRRPHQEKEVASTCFDQALWATRDLAGDPRLLGRGSNFYKETLHAVLWPEKTAGGLRFLRGLSRQAAPSGDRASLAPPTESSRPQLAGGDGHL